MGFKSRGLIIKLLLLSNVFLAISFCYTVYFEFDSGTDIYLTIFSLIIFLIVCFFIYLNYKFDSNLNNIVGKVNFYLSNLIKDSTIDISKISYEPDLIPFFEVLEKFQKGLNEKEQSYQEILGLVNSIAINMDLDKLLDSLIPKLLKATSSSCGAFYLVNNVTNKLELKSSVGFSKNIYSEFDISIGEGLIGVYANEKEIKILTDIPKDTMYYMRSFVGKLKPKNIMVVPISNNSESIGLMLLSSIYDYKLEHNNMLNLIKPYVGIAVSNGLTYEHSKRLSNELKFQNTLILDLNNDLEKRIQDRTLFLNSIINSIEGYIIYAIDKETRVMAWNKSASDFLGYTLDEIIGKKIDIIYSEEQIKSGALKKRIEIANREGKYQETSWHMKKDGTRYYADLTVFKMVDKDSNLIGFTSVTRDITYIVDKDEELNIANSISQKVLDGSSRALLITDEKGIIIFYNRNASKILKTKNLKGQKISEFFEDEKQILDNFEYILKGNSLADWRFNLNNDEGYIVLKIIKLQSEESHSQKLFIHLYI